MTRTGGRQGHTTVDLYGGRHRLAIVAVAILAGSAAAALTGSISVGSALGPSPAAAAARSGRPNIVLIVTDDQRVHSISKRLMPHVWSILRRHGRDFVDASASVEITRGDLVVRFQKRAHNPLLVAAGFDKTESAVPWLGNKRLRLIFG